MSTYFIKHTYSQYKTLKQVQAKAVLKELNRRHVHVHCIIIYKKSDGQKSL